ncbi:spore germination protein [Alicyclobacillaceae bacterium I2511]|nr:spore germination protein [Alicyclobacillaceae bacterium I2511]
MHKVPLSRMHKVPLSSDERRYFMTIWNRLFSKSNPVAGQLHRHQNRLYPHVPTPSTAPDFTGDLEAMLNYTAQSLGTSDDYIVRHIDVNGCSAALLFIITVCDPKIIEETLRTLHAHSFPRTRVTELPEYLMRKVLTGATMSLKINLFDVTEALSSGSLILVIQGAPSVIVLGANLVEHRSPELPSLETSPRGSQISFVENVDINIGLIRNALHTRSFQVKKIEVGYRSRSSIAVLYMNDVADKEVVQIAISRIEAIHVDTINQTAEIEQRICEHPWSFFPLTRVTQRIDNVTRELNQGKVAIMADGDPSILLIPATIQDFFQTGEDYTHSIWESSAMRWLRVIAFIIAVYLPSLYVAFVDFNPELLPKVLGLQIAKSREGVPFPAVMEVLIMFIAIEILREATLRIPKQMAQTVGVVGGLVLGESAVQAGIVSNILLIVIALNSISTFVSPSYEFSNSLRIMSMIMLGASAIVGIFGIILASIWLLYETARLKPFGVFYLTPFNGFHTRDLFIDGILLLPENLAAKRTSHLHPQDKLGAIKLLPLKTKLLNQLFSKVKKS